MVGAMPSFISNSSNINLERADLGFHRFLVTSVVTNQQEDGIAVRSFNTTLIISDAVLPDYIISTLPVHLFSTETSGNAEIVPIPAQKDVTLKKLQHLPLIRLLQKAIPLKK